MVKKAILQGIDPLKVITAASYNPITHYNLDVGLLRAGDSADFLVVNNLKDFDILKTYINGNVVARKGKSLISKIKPKIKNNFKISIKKPSDFSIKASKQKINVIVAIEGQLITEKSIEEPIVSNGYIASDPKRDLLKITVVNRYKKSKPSVAFIKNFGIKDGAIASSVAHDSHNIIAVGVSDKDICNAVNLIIKDKGGISAVGKNRKDLLPLPIAGIISNKEYNWVAKKYIEMNKVAKDLGCRLKAPYMTLSFMALPVIPKLKLSDKGLFDSENFRFIDLFVQT